MPHQITDKIYYGETVSHQITDKNRSQSLTTNHSSNHVKSLSYMINTYMLHSLSWPIWNNIHFHLYTKFFETRCDRPEIRQTHLAYCCRTWTITHHNYHCTNCQEYGMNYTSCHDANTLKVFKHQERKHILSTCAYSECIQYQIWDVDNVILT